MQFGHTCATVSNPNQRAYTIRLYGARFRQGFTPEDAIGSHACSLEALTCVWPNGIPLGCSFLLPVVTLICVQTLKDIRRGRGWRQREHRAAPCSSPITSKRDIQRCVVVMASIITDRRYRLILQPMAVQQRDGTGMRGRDKQIPEL
jgi:hypothetical protein